MEPMDWEEEGWNNKWRPSGTGTTSWARRQRIQEAAQLRDRLASEGDPKALKQKAEAEAKKAKSMEKQAYELAQKAAATAQQAAVTAEKLKQQKLKQQKLKEEKLKGRQLLERRRESPAKPLAKRGRKRRSWKR